MHVSDKLIIQVSILRYKAHIGFIPRFLFWLGFTSYFDKPIQDLIALEKSDSEINEATISKLLELYKNNNDFSPAAQDILEHLQNFYPLQKANTAPDEQQQTLQKIKSLAEFALSEHQSQQSFFSRWFGSADDETTFLTRLISFINTLFTQNVKDRTTSDLTTTIESQSPETTSPWITEIKELIPQLNNGSGTHVTVNKPTPINPEQEVSVKPPVAPPAPKSKEQQSTVPVKKNPSAKQKETRMDAPTYPAPQPPTSKKAPDATTPANTLEEKKAHSVTPVYAVAQPQLQEEMDVSTPPFYQAPEPPNENKVQKTVTIAPPSRPLPVLPPQVQSPAVKEPAAAVIEKQTSSTPVEKKPIQPIITKKPSQTPQPELIKEFKDICTKVTSYDNRTMDCLKKANKLQAELKASSSESAGIEEPKKSGKGTRFFSKPKVITTITDKAKELKLKAQSKLLFKQKRYKSALSTVTRLQNAEFTLITQALLIILKIEDKAFLKEHGDNILGLCRKARILGLLIDISPELKTDLEQLIDTCQGKLGIDQASVTAEEQIKEEAKIPTHNSKNIPNAPPAPVPSVHPKPDNKQTKTDVIDHKPVSEDKQALLLAIIQGTKLKPTIQNKPYSSSDDALAKLAKSPLFQRQISENDELEENSDLQSEEEWLAGSDSDGDTVVELGSFMTPFEPIVVAPLVKTQEQQVKNNKPAPKNEVIDVEDLHKRLELIRMAYHHDFETEEEVNKVYSFQP